MKSKDFEKIITEKIKPLSFSKKKYVYIKEVDEQTIGTIGFGIASNRVPGSLFINPVVGIFNKQVEEIYCQLTGYDSIKTHQATVGTNVGFLIPPENYYKEWELSDSCIDNVTADIIEKIVTYGLPFIEKYRNPNELLKCLEERRYILEITRIYKLPIMYYLLGYKDKALEYVDTVSNNFKDKNNVDAERYLGFTQKFRELLEKIC